ncbi:hypothetical protein L6452_36195 [Arctium lappa]|uniref:Uncharacterized protein n=1 Tax=Arctium lappa TaxID=4217 RepID=A0ACB8Y975_ARCLA|nr:hypothetical protein L6452_36195 [Arctium lappa]
MHLTFTWMFFVSTLLVFVIWTSVFFLIAWEYSNLRGNFVLQYYYNTTFVDIGSSTCYPYVSNFQKTKRPIAKVDTAAEDAGGG